MPPNYHYVSQVSLLGKACQLLVIPGVSLQRMPQFVRLLLDKGGLSQLFEALLAETSQLVSYLIHLLEDGLEQQQQQDYLIVGNDQLLGQVAVLGHTHHRLHPDIFIPVEELKPESGHSLVNGFEVAGGVVPVVDEGAPEVQEVVVVDLVNGPQGHCLEGDLEAFALKGHPDCEVDPALEDSQTLQVLT